MGAKGDQRFAFRVEGPTLTLKLGPMSMGGLACHAKTTITTMDDRAIADYTAFACHLAINPGGVAEWLKAPVLKTGRDESPSWVRIPPPPYQSL